jgi:light-regulated signal transduction histidine kinase (bacteriophytochrome)
MLKIIFSDNGIGIEDENSTTIFGMFKRLGEKNKTPETELVLLYVKRSCKHMVEKINLLPSKKILVQPSRLILPVEQKVRKTRLGLNYVQG